MTGIQALAYLNRIDPIQAPYRVSQPDGIAWLMRATTRAAEGRSGGEPRRRVERALDLYERLLQQKALSTRATVLTDYTHERWDEMQLYRPHTRDEGSLAPWYAPPLGQRMELFATHAQKMIEEAFPEGSPAPRALVEVSCTGYQAPYPAQNLALRRAWHDQIQLVKLGHMGCYASVPALQLAADLSRARPTRRTDAGSDSVSVFSVELCTLHLRPHATDLDQMIANMLFADGAVRFDVGAAPGPRSLALLASHESLVPESAGLMEWKLSDAGFAMLLSRGVSQKIAAGIKGYLDNFLLPLGLNWREIDRFAVHPGGPKIIDTVQEGLDLPEKAVAHSRRILQEHGNMSSSTLPFVWKSLLDDPEVKAGELIVSMAFGPGLTVALNLLQKLPQR